MSSASEFSFDLGFAAGELIRVHCLDIARLVYGVEPTNDFEMLQEKTRWLDDYCKLYGLTDSAQAMKICAEGLKSSHPEMLADCRTIADIFSTYFRKGL